jgi:ComF family protein
LLADAILQLAPEAPPEMIVVPVPLHRMKHAERGFNQARVVAAEALSVLRRQAPDWHLTLAPSTLIRLRATESQAGLTQRRLNMRGAFRVSEPMLVGGRHILLVADILTTGATARAASRALLEAGAESVYVATLARAHRIDRAFDRSLVASENTEPSTDLQATNVHHRQATMNAQNQPSF